jgi:predicted TIM-barrel fold metal-dependent hydrolase
MAKRPPIVDADVHPLTRNGVRDVLPGLSKGWQRRLDLYATYGIGRRPSPIAGPQNTGHNYAKDAYPPEGRPGSDPEFMVGHLLDGHNVGAAILLPPELLGVGRLTMVEDSIQLGRAYNDYFVSEWLPVDPRFQLAIGVQPHNAEAAAEEIRRLADTPGVVGVILPLTDRLLGHPCYFPIYAAASEAGLPVIVHPGQGEGEFQGAPTFGGAPTGGFALWHTSFVTVGINNLLSLVLEGTFQRFPDLTVVLAEFGATWLAPIMWRMDDKWRSLRVDMPWLKEPPSDVVRKHVRLTTQPLEDLPKPGYLAQIFEMLYADEVLMFSSDYPHWDNEFPELTLAGLSEPLLDRILRENALATYPRLRVPVTAG